MIQPNDAGTDWSPERISTRVSRAAMLMIVTACFSSSGYAQEAVRIALRPTIDVNTDVITLGQLATIDGGNHQTRQRMARLDFAIDPDRSASSIRQEEARARLLIAGFNPNEFVVTGTSTVNRRQSNPAMIRDMIVEGIVQHVAGGLQLAPDAVTVELLSEPDPPIPSGIPGVRVEPLEHGDRVVGRKSLEMGLFDGDRMLQSFRISAKTMIRRAVLVTRRPLERGERLTDENCYIDQRPFDHTHRNRWLDADAMGQLTVRRIRAQQILRPTDIESRNRARAENVLRPRDQVTAVVSHGGLQVVMSGMEVMKAGKVGDVIPLRNPTSRKVVYGRIVNSSRVEISY